MAITYLLKINSTIIPKVKGYEVEPNKLYDQAGRNMAGDLRANAIGVFPKIYLEFTYTTQDDLDIILPLLKLFSFTVEYWYPETKTYKTGTFYPGDFKVGLFDKEKQTYKPFSVNLIPFNKLT